MGEQSSVTTICLKLDRAVNYYGRKRSVTDEGPWYLPTDLNPICHQIDKQLINPRRISENVVDAMSGQRRPYIQCCIYVFREQFTFENGERLGDEVDRATGNRSDDKEFVI
jgi:hypothetical protein